MEALGGGELGGGELGGLVLAALAEGLLQGMLFIGLILLVCALWGKIPQCSARPSHRKDGTGKRAIMLPAPWRWSAGNSQDANQPHQEKTALGGSQITSQSASQSAYSAAIKAKGDMRQSCVPVQEHKIQEHKRRKPKKRP